MNIIKTMFVLAATLISCYADDQKVYKLGDTIDFDDSQWVVLSAENIGHKLQGDELTESKTSEGNFIKVIYKVKNKKSTEEQIIETPKLKDSAGNLYNELDDVGMYLKEGENEMTLSQLPANINKKFVSIYEVSADSKGLNFMTRSLGFSPDYKAVEINQ